MPPKVFVDGHVGTTGLRIHELLAARDDLQVLVAAESERKDAALTIEAAGPAILFHQQIKSADAAAEEAPVLLSQNFFRYNDRYTWKDNQRSDKLVSEEVPAQTVYDAQGVISNQTS